MGKTRKKKTRKVKEALSVLDRIPFVFESPESISILAATYNVEQQRMTVTFRGGGHYVYADVPPALWVEFYQAESKGKFFAAAIRPMFNGTAVQA